jgi:hypothetical protein
MDKNGERDVARIGLEQMVEAIVGGLTGQRKIAREAAPSAGRNPRRAADDAGRRRP